jgi:hypothetical protein
MPEAVLFHIEPKKEYLFLKGRETWNEKKQFLFFCRDGPEAGRDSLGYNGAHEKRFFAMIGYRSIKPPISPFPRFISI